MNPPCAGREVTQTATQFHPKTITILLTILVTPPGTPYASLHHNIIQPKPDRRRRQFLLHFNFPSRSDSGWIWVAVTSFYNGGAFHCKSALLFSTVVIDVGSFGCAFDMAVEA